MLRRSRSGKESASSESPPAKLKKSSSSFFSLRRSRSSKGSPGVVGSPSGAPTAASVGAVDLRGKIDLEDEEEAVAVEAPAPSATAASPGSNKPSAAHTPMTLSATTSLAEGYTFLRVSVNLPADGRLGIGLDNEYCVTALMPGGAGELAGVDVDDQLVEVR